MRTPLIPIYQIARLCHEANREYCLSLQDFSQVPWDEAPEWQRDSAINGVQFHLENPEAGPEGSHANWMAVKEAEGWKWGEVKDAHHKTHPCMVPYADLPEEQRRKDAIFTGIVHALSA